MPRRKPARGAGNYFRQMLYPSGPIPEPDGPACEAEPPNLPAFARKAESGADAFAQFRRGYDPRSLA